MPQLGVPQKQTNLRFHETVTPQAPWTSLWECSCGDALAALTIVPDLHLHVIFDLSGTLEVEPFLINPGIKPVKIDLPPEVILVGLTFPLWEARPLAPTLAAAEAEYPHTVHLDADWIFYLYFELLEYRNSKAEGSNSTVFDQFMPFASSQLRNDFCSQFLHGADGTEDHTVWSDRHRRRMYQATLGLSPKQVQRVARFQRLLTELTSTGCATYDEFYDQAHGINEFRALATITPGEFLRHY